MGCLPTYKGKRYNSIEELISDNKLETVLSSYKDNISNFKKLYAYRVLSKSNKEIANKIKNDILINAKSLYESLRESLKEKNKELSKDKGAFVKQVYDNIVDSIDTIDNPDIVRKIKKTMFEYMSSLKDTKLSLASKIHMLADFTKSQVEVHTNKSSFFSDKKQTYKADYEANMASLYSAISDNIFEAIDGIYEQEGSIEEFNNKYHEYIKSEMADNIWNDFRYNLAVEVAKETGDVTVEEFSKLPNELQNSEEAVDNHLLDQFKEILKNPEHFVEMTSPNTTYDMEIARDLLRTEDEGSNDSWALQNTQLKLTEKNLRGRDSKAISINRDTYISLASKLGITIPNAIKIKYSSKVSKANKESYIYDRLEDTVISKNSYKLTNDVGRINTSYNAQTTANILDNVAIPLSKNFRRAFGEFRVLTELGTDMNLASLFIHHPAITKLLDLGENADMYYNREKARFNYSEMFNELLNDMIVHYYNENNLADNVFTQQEFLKYKKSIRDLETSNKNPKLKSKATKPKPLYFTMYRAATIMEDLFKKSKFYNADTQSISEYVIDEEMYYNANNENRYNETKDDILNSLIALKQFQRISNISNEIDNVIKYISQDRKGLTKDFDNYIDPADLELTELSINLENLYKNDIMSLFNSSDPLIAGAQLLGNGMAYDIYKDLFIERDPNVSAFMNDFNIDSRVINDIFAFNIKGLPFFRDTNIKQLLSVNSEFSEILDVTNFDNLKAFEEMSVFEKLVLIQNQYRNVLPNSHFLHKLVPVKNNNYISATGFLGISFNADVNMQNYIDDFSAMWYNTNNPFFHLLARDLVKYAYFTSGFKYGKNISKIIPNSILENDPTVIKNVKGVDILNGIGLTTEYYKQISYHKSPDFVNPYNYDYAVDYARRNYKDNTIVPVVKTTRVYDSNGNARIKKNTPNWNPLVAYNGIIVVPSHLLNGQTSDIRNATVIKRYDNKGNIKLYKKISLLVDSQNSKIYRDINAKDDSNTVMHFYVPVSKLGQFEFNEDTSIDNSEILPFDFYYMAIRDLVKQEKLIVQEDSSTVFDRHFDSNYRFTKSFGFNEVPVNGKKYSIRESETGDIRIFNNYGESVFNSKTDDGVPIAQEAKQIFLRYFFHKQFGVPLNANKPFEGFISNNKDLYAFELKEVVDEFESDPSKKKSIDFKVYSYLNSKHNLTKSSVINRLLNMRKAILGSDSITDSNKTMYNNKDIDSYLELKNELDILANEKKC